MSQRAGCGGRGSTRGSRGTERTGQGEASTEHTWNRRPGLYAFPAQGMLVSCPLPHFFLLRIKFIPSSSCMQRVGVNVWPQSIRRWGG